MRQGREIWFTSEERKSCRWIFIFLGVPPSCPGSFYISWRSKSCGVHPPPPHPSQLLVSWEFEFSCFPITSLQKNLTHPWNVNSYLLTSWHFRNSSYRVPRKGLLSPHPKHPMQVKAPKCVSVLSVQVYKSDREQHLWKDHVPVLTAPLLDPKGSLLWWLCLNPYWKYSSNFSLPPLSCSATTPPTPTQPQMLF